MEHMTGMKLCMYVCVCVCMCVYTRVTERTLSHKPGSYLYKTCQDEWLSLASPDGVGPCSLVSTHLPLVPFLSSASTSPRSLGTKVLASGPHLGSLKCHLFPRSPPNFSEPWACFRIKCVLKATAAVLTEGNNFL
jgi:hypothetical protein